MIEREDNVIVNLPPRTYIVKPDEIIAAISGDTPGTGTASIYGIDDDGVLFDIGNNEEVENATDEDTTTTDYYEVDVEDATGVWVIGRKCSCS